MVFIISNDQSNKLVSAKWGLVPFFAKDEKFGYKTINAKAETIAEKPAFRSSFKSKRCLIPCDGFYEWKNTPSGKIPYYIFLKNHDLFAFAGLYDDWKDETGKSIRTFSIITVPPNQAMKNIHNRMPAILKINNEREWLSDFKQDKLLGLLKPYDEEMEMHQISTLVNSPANDGAAVIKKIENKRTLLDFSH
jgi:putative SOS response-associated peptidase YedK